MKAFLYKAAAFIRRDFRIESGYQAAFIMGLVESIMLLIILTNKLHRTACANGCFWEPEDVWGGVTFRLHSSVWGSRVSSIHVADVFIVDTDSADDGLSKRRRRAKTGPITVVIMSSFYSLLSGVIELVMILAGGVLLFGVDLREINVPATLPVVLFSIAIFVAFGVLSASAIVWLKKGDPITWVLGGMGSILGGAYFPIERDAGLDAEVLLFDSAPIHIGRVARDDAQRREPCLGGQADRDAAGDISDSAARQRGLSRGTQREKRRTHAVLGSKVLRETMTSMFQRPPSLYDTGHSAFLRSPCRYRCNCVSGLDRAITAGD